MQKLKERYPSFMVSSTTDFFQTEHFIIQYTTGEWNSLKETLVPPDYQKYNISLDPEAKYIKFRICSVIQKLIRSLPSTEVGLEIKDKTEETIYISEFATSDEIEDESTIVSDKTEKTLHIQTCHKSPIDKSIEVAEDSTIITASKNGHTHIVKLLFEKNPNVDLCDKDGISPLYAASQLGHTGIVRLLLGRNPNIDLCNSDGCSPLNIASHNGHIGIVRLLLENNPNVDLCSNDGCSPLYNAIPNGHTKIVRLLLKENQMLIFVTKMAVVPCH
ncbi:unnamed protein product [Mytilus edulis]|uniref:Uncharacterized protein n=1 Tax=Mytilus edulis TaxID=6550 RepID=A0A8S3VF48_MYTED|nr:unnamed protein product [Mytilus edulis]